MRGGYVNDEAQHFPLRLAHRAMAQTRNKDNIAISLSLFTP